MEQTRGTRFFWMEGIFFVAFCSLFAYVTSIMLEYGYTEVQCGLVSMLQYIVMMAAGPLYGQLIDLGLSPKKLFLILSALGMVLTPLLPLALGHGFVFTMIAFGVISFLDFCGPNVLDTWISMAIRRDPELDYGRIRSAGSIFYAGTALVSGYLMVPLGVKSLLILHFIFLGFSMILAARMEAPEDLPESPCASAFSEVSEKVSTREGLVVLFSSRSYVVFLISGTLYYFATRAINTFMPVVLGHIGGDVSSYGLSVFLYCVGECIMMRIASRMIQRGCRLEILFTIALITLSIRLALLGFLHNMTLVMLTQVFLSVAFGSFIRFSVEYAAGLFPPQYSGRAILVSIAVTQGVGSILGNLLGGYLIKGIGVPGYLYLCAGILVLALGIFLLGNGRSQKAASPETL